MLCIILYTWEMTDQITKNKAVLSNTHCQNSYLLLQQLPLNIRLITKFLLLQHLEPAT